MALKRDGTVVTWGEDYCSFKPLSTMLSGVTAIAAGACHDLAVRSDGTVAAWGSDEYGQTDVPAGLSGVVAAGDAQFADGTRTTPVATNVYGQASVQLIAGRTPGTVSVTASIGTVSDFFIETVAATSPCTENARLPGALAPIFRQRIGPHLCPILANLAARRGRGRRHYEPLSRPDRPPYRGRRQGPSSTARATAVTPADRKRTGPPAARNVTDCGWRNR